MLSLALWKMIVLQYICITQVLINAHPRGKVEHVESETEVFIRGDCGRETENGTVSIGLINITTWTDVEGLLRHVVVRQPGKTATDMGLNERDDLLGLNDKVLDGLTIDEMKDLFLTVRVDTEFTLIKRTKGGSDSKQITTIIKLKMEDDMIVPEVTHKQRATCKNGDIRADADKQIVKNSVYIRSKKGYLRNDNGVVKIKSHIKCTDLRFHFELLKYHVKVIENHCISTKELYLLRHSQDMPTGNPPFFLYVHNKKIQFKAAPMDLSTPKIEDLQKGTSSGGFSVQNAAFLRHSVNPDNREKSAFYFESYTERGYYLALKGHSLTLERIAEDDLPYKGHAKFHIWPSKSD